MQQVIRLLGSLVLTVIWLGVGVYVVQAMPVDVGREPVAAVQGTPVTGYITVSTTWTVANSPYILEGDVVVDFGVVLTIEAGVVVQGQANGVLWILGRLVSEGTAANPVLFTSVLNSGPDQWGNIYIRGSASLTETTVQYASGPGGALVVLGDEPVDINHSRFISNGGTGIRVMTNSFHLFEMNDVTFSGNGDDVVEMWSDYDVGAGSLLGPVTLQPQPGLRGYRIDAFAVHVPPTVTLTIDAGTTMLFSERSILAVRGHLITNGTVTQPVTFTSVIDSGPGQWVGLVLDGTADMRETTIRYAGSYEHPALVAMPITASNQILLQDVHFVANGEEAIRTRADQWHQLQMNNVSFDGNGRNRVVIETYNYRWGDERWYEMQASVTATAQVGLEGYEIEGTHLKVPQNMTLTMGAGTQLMLPANSLLQVEGQMTTLGTATAPVTVTSGLDTAAGEWLGVVVTGSLDLTQTTIQYAASSGLLVAGGDASLKATTIRDGLGDGLVVEGGTATVACGNLVNNGGSGAVVTADVGGTLTLNGGSIVGNGGLGVENLNGQTVTATMAWWGAADGPSGVGSGSGSAVSANVTYAPWVVEAGCELYQSFFPLVLTLPGRSAVTGSWPTLGGSCESVVHRSEMPYFVAGAGTVLATVTAPTTAYMDVGVVGEAAVAYFYQVVARDCGAEALATTTMGGVFDFALVVGD